MQYKPGDVCSFLDQDGFYGILKILEIVRGKNNEFIYNVAIYQELFEFDPTEDDLEEDLHLYIGHLPIAEKYFLSSQPNPIRQKDVSQRELSGFREWLKLWEKGKAGIFQLPISECIGFIAKSMRDPERYVN